MGDFLSVPNKDKESEDNENSQVSQLSHIHLCFKIHFSKSFLINKQKKL